MPARIDKQQLVETLAALLAGELERATRHALDAAAAATHEENRAESDKDMRSTETSYVARGQALRARELETAIQKLRAMPVRDFRPEDAIEASALIDVEQDGKRARYWLVPDGGGQLLGNVRTLGTTSPLGRALLGLRAEEEVEVITPQGPRACLVLRVV